MKSRTKSSDGQSQITYTDAVLFSKKQNSQNQATRNTQHTTSIQNAYGPTTRSTPSRASACVMNFDATKIHITKW